MTVSEFLLSLNQYEYLACLKHDDPDCDFKTLFDVVTYWASLHHPHIVITP
jgi:hypothetical protein